MRAAWGKQWVAFGGSGKGLCHIMKTTWERRTAEEAGVDVAEPW